ncbi:TniQ family protein [Pseudomonas putida]|uniref:TniQ family protein n=1 Tax=Pseudomonas putida TaxID=303 RepID=UPI0039E0E97D
MTLLPLHEFWSPLSGNERVLERCEELVAQAISSTTCGSYVLLVSGESGSGKTSLAFRLESLLRDQGQRVLSISKTSALEPWSFSENLDLSLGLPPEISRKIAYATAGLSVLQLEVMKARRYDSICVHDLDEYSCNEASISKATSLFRGIIRSGSVRTIVAFGTPESVAWLAYSLRQAEIAYDIIDIAPMCDRDSFEGFICSLVKKWREEDFHELMSSFDIHKLQTMSKGRVGDAVDLLRAKIEQIDISKTLESHQTDCADALSRHDSTGSHESKNSARLPPVQPFKNESFSSWVVRQSLHSRNSVDLFLAENLAKRCGIPGVDPDKQYENLDLLQDLSLDNRLFITAHFKPSDTGWVPYDKALNYCPQCFARDLGADTGPAWRATWRTPRSCVCLEHESPVLLERLSTQRYSILDKAWTAFAEYVASPAPRLGANFPLQHPASVRASSENAQLVSLAARVEIWFRTLTGETFPTLASAEYLLSYWLQEPTSTNAQGFARSYFFFRLNKPQPLTKQQKGQPTQTLNPASSTPRDVAVAMWMLGIAYDVISLSEAEFIRDVTRPFSIPFPVSSREVASAGKLAFSVSQRATYAEYARETLLPIDFDGVTWAIQ